MKSKISDADLLQRKKQSEADKAENARKLEELKRLKKVRRHEQRVKKKSERAQHFSQSEPQPLNVAAEKFALNSEVLRPPLPPLSASGGFIGCDTAADCCPAGVGATIFASSLRA